MSHKRCRTCRDEKSINDFYSRKRAHDRSEPMLDCKRCTIKLHGQTAKKAIAERRNRKGRGRALIQASKAGPCVDCGLVYPPECMDFDHRDATLKVRAVSAMSQQTPETILAEIAKCDLVCSNCHRIRTAKRGYARPARSVQV